MIVRVAWFVGLLLSAALAAGCGPKRMSDAEFGLPENTEQTRADREQALVEGTRALAAFRREQVRATVEKSAPNYAPARARLAGAIAKLRPAPGKMPAPQLESCVQPLENALAAMDRVIAAGKANDPVGLEEGWALFDLSVETLFMILGPPAFPQK